MDDTPANLYATGRYNHVNILLGTLADEGSTFVLLNPLFVDYVTRKEAPFISREIFEQILPIDVSLYLGKMI